jgi:hypothetical protein
MLKLLGFEVCSFSSVAVQDKIWNLLWRLCHSQRVVTGELQPARS